MQVDAHTHRHSFVPAVRIVSLCELRDRNLPSHSFAVGIHPWDLPQVTTRDRELVLEWSQGPHCVAIGECGLDRARRLDWQSQVENLQWHWQLAEAGQRPLVLHCVRASSDLLHLLKRQRPKTPWLWHDFSGPVNVIESTLKLHPQMHFSFGPRGIHRSDFRQLWERVPEERRLLETDDSGVLISTVYQAVQPREDVLAQTFQKLFGLTGEAQVR